jgi:hypothetical protein
VSHETNLTSLPPDEVGFAEVAGLIAAARQRAYQAVNTSLIDLYWQVGEYISRKFEAAEWGTGVVPKLAHYIARTHPGQRGFTRSNLFRMMGRRWNTFSSPWHRSRSERLHAADPIAGKLFLPNPRKLFQTCGHREGTVCAWRASEEAPTVILPQPIRPLALPTRKHVTSGSCG